MNISLDVSWKSLNKHGEELCGDTVGILKNDVSDIFHFIRRYGKRCQS